LPSRPLSLVVIDVVVVVRLTLVPRGCRYRRRRSYDKQV